VRRGFLQDCADLLDHAVDDDVALAAGGLDRGKDLTNGVHHVQQRVRGPLVHHSPAVAQLGQQALAHMREALEPAEPQETAGALDGVDRAEDAAQQFA